MHKLIFEAIKNIPFPKEKLEQIVIEKITHKNFLYYDYSTNIGHLLESKETKKKFIEKLEGFKEIEEVKFTENGFINIRVNTLFINRKLQDFLQYRQIGNRDSINIEYVSANPTGPLHVGNARWAVYGDFLKEIFKKIGYKVTSEYYVNDKGGQIDSLLNSIESITKKKLTLEEKKALPYYSHYLQMLADEKSDWNKEEVVDAIMKRIISSLKSFKTSYDQITYESSLYKKFDIDKFIQTLQENKLIYEKDSAVFFKSSTYGDEKDRVIIKQDKDYTYFMSDIIYLFDKLKRGFKKNILILGADHHGYIERIKAAHTALSALFKYNSTLIVLVGQLIEVKTPNNERSKMSKRFKNIVTLEELTKKLNPDCVRYNLIRQPFNNFLLIDVEKLNQRNTKERLYYVQYAYARIKSIIRMYCVKNNLSSLDFLNKFVVNLDKDQELEKKFLINLLSYKDVVDEVLLHNERAHIIIYYLENLCKEFHAFYEKKQILIWTDKRLLNLRIYLVYQLYLVMNQVFDLLKIEKIESL